MQRRLFTGKKWVSFFKIDEWTKYILLAIDFFFYYSLKLILPNRFYCQYRCGKVIVEEGYHNEYDLNKAYPDCCVKIVEDY